SQNAKAPAMDIEAFQERGRLLSHLHPGQGVCPELLQIAFAAICTIDDSQCSFREPPPRHSRATGAGLQGPLFRVTGSNATTCNRQTPSLPSRHLLWFCTSSSRRPSFFCRRSLGKRLSAYCSGMANALAQLS